MAKSKAEKKVVVNQAYFELVDRKAQMLDGMFENAIEGEIVVHVSIFKDWAKIQKDWDKADADSLDGSEPYVPPADEE